MKVMDKLSAIEAKLDELIHLMKEREVQLKAKNEAEWWKE